MISSSNFFPKCMFDSPEDNLLPNKQLGPWLEKRRQYATIDNTASPSSLSNKAKLIKIRNKPDRKEVVLPVIISKLFELVPLKPRKQEQFMIHRRKNHKNEKSRIPDIYRSLDMKISDDQRLIRDIHNRFHNNN